MQSALKRSKRVNTCSTAQQSIEPQLTEEYRAADFLIPTSKRSKRSLRPSSSKTLPPQAKPMGGAAPCLTCHSGRAAGSGCCSPTAGCCQVSRPNSAVAAWLVLQQFVNLAELFACSPTPRRGRAGDRGACFWHRMANTPQYSHQRPSVSHPRMTAVASKASAFSRRHRPPAVDQLRRAALHRHAIGGGLSACS